jgi:hypothetical protein
MIIRRSRPKSLSSHLLRRLARHFAATVPIRLRLYIPGLIRPLGRYGPWELGNRPLPCRRLRTPGVPIRATPVRDQYAVRLRHMFFDDRRLWLTL